MKTDRFSSASTRAAAVMLAGLLLAASLPAAGQTITFRFGKETASTKALSLALARLVQKAQKGFKEDRRALRTVQGPGGEPAHLRQEVADLIARTGKDLDQAIEQVGKGDLGPLQAWANEELRRVQEALAPPSGRTAALPAAVARIASLGSPPSPGPASVIAAVLKEETIPVEISNRLLDQVAEVVSRIFFLAERDDLYVELWVGSTPAPTATFRFYFWSQGKIKGSTPAPMTVGNNGKRARVLRGLYAYEAGWTKGAVTELVAYPSPAGAPLMSEQLNLVSQSSYFCCRFNKQDCHHVDNKKECRP